MGFQLGFIIHEAEDYPLCKRKISTNSKYGCFRRQHGYRLNTKDNYLGRFTWDELEEERAKFTVGENIAGNLWDKYNYKILWREIQRSRKTFSKPCVLDCII